MGFHLVKTRGQPICVFISIYGAPNQRDSLVQVVILQGCLNDKFSSLRA